MDHTHDITIDEPISVVWPALIDLTRVAQALPGAQLEDQESDGSFNGLFRIKLGAFSAAFRGRARYSLVDEELHRFVLEGSGGSAHGDATLTVTSQAEATAEGTTTVRLISSIDLTGRLAQLGSSMADDVLGQLMDVFSRNLVSSISAGRADTPGSAGPAAAEPGAVRTSGTPAVTDAFDLGGSLSLPLRKYGLAAAAAAAGLVAGLLVGRSVGSGRRSTVPVVLRLVAISPDGVAR